MIGIGEGGGVMLIPLGMSRPGQSLHFGALHVSCLTLLRILIALRVRRSRNLRPGILRLGQSLHLTALLTLLGHPLHQGALESLLHVHAHQGMKEVHSAGTTSR